MRARRSGSKCALWTVVSAGKTFRVKTCSARDALSFAEERTNMPAVLLDLELHAEARVTTEASRRTTGRGRHERRRDALLPEAIRRRGIGESVTQIAKGLHLPRETLRDWLLIAGA